MKKSIQPQVLVQSSCALGEGPVWDSKRQALFWVDIVRGHIHEYVVSTHIHKQTALPAMIGTVALYADESSAEQLVVALQNGIALYHRPNGKLQWLIHPENDLPNNRYNDGKCDPAGRFWIGSMAVSEEKGAGNLYRINADLSYQKVIDNLTISNGMAWSFDAQTMYFIDTPTWEVWAFDFEQATGTISNQRTVIRIPQEEGFPDGMCIDTEGHLWIAHWGGWQVARWNPSTGQKLLSIPMPVAQVTSCTFGGANLQDLYITTAAVSLDEATLSTQPLAGCTFVVPNCGFQGFDTVRCRSFTAV